VTRSLIRSLTTVIALSVLLGAMPPGYAQQRNPKFAGGGPAPTPGTDVVAPPVPSPPEAVPPVNANSIPAIREKVSQLNGAYDDALSQWEAKPGDAALRNKLGEARKALRDAQAELDEALELRASGIQTTLEAINSSIDKLRNDFIADSLVTESEIQGAMAPAGATAGVTTSRRVHLMIYATANDGNPDGIVQGAQANLVFVESLFKTMCGDRLASIQKRTSFGGTTILTDVNNLKVAPDDAIVCYVATHGAFTSPPDLRHWMAGTLGNDRIDRGLVFSKIKTRGASLNLMITDACGEISGRGDLAPLPEAPAGPNWPLWYLIFKTKGNINVNAAVPGRLALYRVQDPGFPQSSHGGVFTRAFVNQAVFGEPVSSDETGWIKFFRSVSLVSTASSLSVNGQLRQQPPAALLSDGGRFLQPLSN
jgi:hypothetical protein